MPRITLISVYVDDQDKALGFYTDVLGFVKKTEIPLGEARWLTVVSPEDVDGTEAARARRTSCSAALQASAPGRWHPLHILRRRRRERRARATPRARCALHAGAARCRTGDDRGVR